jgi:ribonucleoside-diphosphate reductase beta chain
MTSPNRSLLVAPIGGPASDYAEYFDAAPDTNRTKHAYSEHDDDDRVVTLWDAARATRASKKTKTRTPAVLWPFKWDAREQDRHALFPILHRDIFDVYKLIERQHWVVEEIDLSQDAASWKNMRQEERNFASPWLGFFSGADNALIDLIDVLRGVVNGMESKMVYSVQEAQEQVHVEAYQAQIEELHLSPSDTELLRLQFFSSPPVHALVEWIENSQLPTTPIAEVVVSTAFSEGLLFSGAFACFQWLRERNLLPGITAFNRMILRDEGVHASHSTLLARKYLQSWARPSADSVARIARSAVKVAAQLVAHTLPVPILDMNADLLTQYLQFQADYLCTEMGYRPVFNAKNPFPFMEKQVLNGENKTNFFEKKTTEYQGLTKGALDFCITRRPAVP